MHATCSGESRSKTDTEFICQPCIVHRADGRELSDDGRLDEFDWEAGTVEESPQSHMSIFVQRSACLTANHTHNFFIEHSRVSENQSGCSELQMSLSPIPF